MAENEANPSALLRDGAEQPFDTLDERRAFCAVSENLLGRPEDPATLDRFRIEHRVGSGGMGVVYAAFDPKLGRRVALKLLKPDRSSTRDQERLVDEAKALARLNHPNIVGVHEIGTVEGRVFIAMELVEGAPLSTWLRTPRTWKEVARVALDAGRGLVAAHESGLVHRDFKPANVMLRDDGRVVVLDFGLARTHDSFASDASTGHDAADELRESTLASAIAGTPAYMAPEQHLGRVATPQSDQFSFCMTMYEAAYGDRPFDAKTRIALLEAIDQGKFRPRPKSRNVPSWFRRILERGLQPAPRDRWPSMEALLASLEGKLSPPWRRAAVPVAVAGGAAAITFAAFADEPASCAEEALAISETWNDEVAEGIRGELQSIDHPAAAHAPGVLDAQLDAYADAWRERWETACTAGRRTPPTDTRSLRVLACLEGQRQWLASSLELLSSPTGPVVADAARLVPNATNLQACDDPEQAAPTADGQEALQLHAEVEYKVNEARTEARLGRIDGAERMLDQAAEAAAASGDDSLRSRVSLARGQLDEQRGDLVAARIAFEKALLESERAHDTVARLSAMRRIARHLLDSGELQEAARVVMRVEAAHQRFESRPWTWDTELLELRSRLAAQSRKYEEAVTLARKRLDLVRHHAPDDRDRNLRARMFVLRARMPVTEDESLDAAIGEVLEEAIALHGPVHETTALAHGYVGHRAYRAGQIEAALVAFEKALAIRERLGTEVTGLLKVLNNVAVGYARTGEPEKAEAALDRIVEVSRANSPTYDRRLNAALVNLAGVYGGRGDYDDATRTLRESLKLTKSLDGPNSPTSVIAMLELSRALVLSEEVGAAEMVLKQAREIEQRERGKQTDLGAELLGGLANIAYVKGDFEAMLPLATSAYETLSPRASVSVRAQVSTLLVSALLGQESSNSTQKADDVLHELEQIGNDLRLREGVRILMSEQRATIDAQLEKKAGSLSRPEHIAEGGAALRERQQ
ncbi:MAG: protein kinase domain-containing protein [Nannocystales bacterium]